MSLTPSKLSALPDTPVVHVGPFCNAPLLPFPELSVAFVPVPSSSARWTRSPDGGADAFDTVTATDADFVLFDVSRAIAVSVCEPLPADVVFHVVEYGDDVSSAPMFTPSSWNCTPATPTLSDAVAETVTALPETVVPLDGAVMLTDGCAVSPELVAP